MTTRTLTDEVKCFVAEELATRVEGLSPFTALQNDIGVDGDDGAQFMAAFARRFSVNIDEFQFDLHFGREGCDPFTLLYTLVFRSRSWMCTQITIGDLVEAARTGRWHTPAREPS